MVQTIHANNALGFLASDITTSSTTLVLQAGQGARFPAVPGSPAKQFFVTVEDRANGKLEIMLCTSRTVDSLAVTRAQQGTTAKAFSAGVSVSNRVTAAFLDSFETRLEASSEAAVAAEAAAAAAVAATGTATAAAADATAAAAAATAAVSGVQDDVDAANAAAAAAASTASTAASNAATAVTLASAANALAVALEPRVDALEAGGGGGSTLTEATLDATFAGASDDPTYGPSIGTSVVRTLGAQEATKELRLAALSGLAGLGMTIFVREDPDVLDPDPAPPMEAGQVFVLDAEVAPNVWGVRNIVTENTTLLTRRFFGKDEAGDLLAATYEETWDILDRAAPFTYTTVAIASNIIAFDVTAVGRAVKTAAPTAITTIAFSCFANLPTNGALARVLVKMGSTGYEIAGEAGPTGVATQGKPTTWLPNRWYIVDLSWLDGVPLYTYHEPIVVAA